LAEGECLEGLAHDNPISEERWIPVPPAPPVVTRVTFSTGFKAIRRNLSQSLKLPTALFWHAQAHTFPRDLAHFLMFHVV